MSYLPEWIGDVANAAAVLGLVWAAGRWVSKQALKLYQQESTEHYAPQQAPSSRMSMPRSAKQSAGLRQSLGEELRKWILHKIMLVDKSPAQHFGIIMGLFLCLIFMFYISYAIPRGDFVFPGAIGEAVRWIPIVSIGVVALMLTLSIARLFWRLEYQKLELQTEQERKAPVEREREAAVRRAEAARREPRRRSRPPNNALRQMEDQAEEKDASR